MTPSGEDGDEAHRPVDRAARGGGRPGKGAKGFRRSGRIFLTWREIEDIAAGKGDVTWGTMVEKVRDCNPMVVGARRAVIHLKKACQSQPGTLY